MKKSLISSQSDFDDFSDSEVLEYPQDKLDKFEEVIKKVAEITEDSSILQKPAAADTACRRFLTRTSTLEAKLKYVQDDLAKFNEKFVSLEEIENRKKEVEIELSKTKETNSSVETENAKISKKIEEIRGSFQQGGNGDALNDTENEIENLEKDFQKFENEISNVKSGIFTVQNNVSEEEKKTKELESEIESLKKATDTNNVQQLSEELAEKRVKRMNIQKALDSFISESEAKSNARRIVLAQRKEQLMKDIEATKQKIEDISNQRIRVARMKDDISRLEAIISREEKKKEEPEVVIQKEEPMNKARISRFAMLLLSEGPSKELISSIGSELKWKKEQVEECYKLSQKGKDKGIGDQWVAWLDDATKD